jgi:AcrR family transcriptional regulator
VSSALQELLRERGRESISIPMLAERAEVQPSSLYRRWGDIGTLMNDLATYRLDPSRPLPSSGDLRADLTAWAREIAQHYRDPVHAAMLRAGAATAGDAESDCLRNRRAEAGILIAARVAEGESSPHDPTVDDILNHVIAPIIYRVIFLPESVDDDLVDAVIAQLFAIPR